MCAHYLVDPIACTPASGWEKGQVENQVGLVRERFFTPRLRVKSIEELNGWLLDQCVTYAKGHPHPENKEITVWQAFETERPSLVPYVGAFDGFHAVPVSVSKTCLIRFDNNRYSVMASAVGRPVEVRAYAERIELRQGGHVVGEHARRFGRNETVFEPWHYVPVLARKPGALRNGAPFKDWVLPAAFERVRRKLAGADDGDRQMVGLLTAAMGRRAGRRRGRLPGGARGQRPLRRRRPQHLGPTPRARARHHHRHPRRAAPAARARRRLRALRHPEEHHVMERSEILATMVDLKLYGMKAGYDEIITTAVKRQHEPQRIVGDLLQAEIAEKQARSIKYQITISKLPLAKDIEEFRFDGTPINEMLVLRSRQRRIPCPPT